MSTINDMDSDTTHTLDGNPADFPQREQSMEEYRVIWQGWLGSWGSSRQARWGRKMLESEMDQLQLKISRGPGPIWKNFQDSLPGYSEHQRSLYAGFVFDK